MRAQNVQKARHGTEKKRERPWYNTNGTEIGAYIGIRLIMGLYHCPQMPDYWSNKPMKPYFHVIRHNMSRNRFEQIHRFFKVDNPNREPIGNEFWKKIERLVYSFREGALKYYRPGSRLAIDELLERYEGRSKHIMEMSAKAAGKGFKCYAICDADYMLDFLFTSKVGVGQKPHFSPVHIVIL